MSVLIFISILFELLFIHFCVEIYKENKIHIPVFLIMTTLIGSLLIRNFITLHKYLYNFADVDYWYSEVMIFLVSITLLVLAFSLKRMNIESLEDGDDKVIKPFEELIDSIAFKSISMPYIVLNENNIVVLANNYFEELISYDGIFHRDTALTLEEMTGLQCSYEMLENISNTVQVIKWKESNELMVKVHCQSIDNGQYYILLFENFSLLQEALETAKSVKEELSTFENILEAGKWTLNIDDDSFICSEKARRLLGMPMHSFNLKTFKEKVHPEDIVKIETMIGKIVWISGRHVINLRMIIDEQIKPISVNFHTIVDVTGMPYQIVGFVQDQSQQNSELTEMMLRERDDYLATELTSVTQHTFQLLKELARESSIVGYSERIESSLKMMETLHHKINKPTLKNNLLNGDKTIEEIVTNLQSLGYGYKTLLNLNAANSLLEIDSLSFKEAISHIITDVIRVNKNAELQISSTALMQDPTQDKMIYQMECGIKKNELAENYLDDFLKHLNKPSNGIEDTKLYHAHLIIKKYFGDISIIENENYYLIQVKLPSITLFSVPERKPLDEVLYIGNFELTRKIVSDYFAEFDVDICYSDVISKANIINHSVVILDASIDVLVLRKLSRQFEKVTFYTFDDGHEFNAFNIFPIKKSTGLSELIYTLSKKYIMVAKMKVMDENITLIDKLKEMDAHAIKATESCKNIGGSPLLYLEDISLYNQYYGSIYSKLRALWQEGYHQELNLKILQMKSEANILGFASIEHYLEALLEKSFSSLSNPKSLVDFQEAFRPLDKAIVIIGNYNNEKGKSKLNSKVEEKEIVHLLNECIETLKENKPIRSGELLQELLTYNSMKPSETTLMESKSMIQQYSFAAAIENIETIKMSVLNKELSM